MSRINWMTEEELHAAEEQLELAVQQFDQAMHTVNGQPRPSISGWMFIGGCNGSGPKWPMR
jgi:hypothetical protein